MAPRHALLSAGVATALFLTVIADECPSTTPFNRTGRINIHIVPHTHDDVGWNREYLEYYKYQVQYIIHNIVVGLQSNPERKFTYVEQAFFQYHYERQSSDWQKGVQALVASGQLSFVNGAFSMHDEACPTFVDMLDNTHVGQRVILDNFGPSALPNTTWQIDPFGHSAFQGVLSSSLSGYLGVLWARESDSFKLSSCANRGVERVWTPSVSLGADATTIAGVFVDNDYGTSGFSSRCTGALPGNPNCHNGSAPNAWGAHDMQRWINNTLFSRAPYMRYSGDEVDVLVLQGGDFTWLNAPDWFSYLDAVILALNSEPSGRFRAFYSTPGAYLSSKLSRNVSLVNYAGDFMPYADDSAAHNLWTGYFTSRPAFKGFVRESSALHQAARQLQVLGGATVTDLGPSNALFKLERAIGITQHHDSISGTAKEYVNRNYSGILEAGRQDAYGEMAAAFANATGYRDAPFTFCPLANVTLCPALEMGAPAVILSYNSLGQAARGANIRVAAGFPPGVASYAVTDATGALITAQIVPLSPRDAALRALYNGSSTPVRWLVFTGDVPAAGFAAFFIEPSVASVPSTHDSMVMPAAAAGDTTFTNGRLTLTVSAATGFLSGYADTVTGVSLPLAQSWLSYISANNATFNGSAQASGAYIFRPGAGHPFAEPIQAAPASVVLVTGPVLNETWHTYGYVTQSTRLWGGVNSVEIEWTVGPVDVSDGNGHEVITRYSSGLRTGGSWTTDSNCREYQLRTRNAGPQGINATAEPVSSNYHPVNCLVKTGSPAVTVAVAVDRSEGACFMTRSSLYAARPRKTSTSRRTLELTDPLSPPGHQIVLPGGSSLADGDLELMVHRRLLFDDQRGVDEPLNEPGLDGKGLIVRGTHWLVVAPAAVAPTAYKALHAVALSLPRTVMALAGLGSLTPDKWLAAHRPSASLLASPLPPNVHLTTVHMQDPHTLLLRLSHLFEVGEDPVFSADATVDLATLLADVMITAAVEMTLPGTKRLADVSPMTYTSDRGPPVTVPHLPPAPAGSGLTVTLRAQQIRTFRCTIA